MAYQESQPEAGKAATVEEVSPTHSIHPPHHSMRGVNKKMTESGSTAQVGFLHILGACQLRAGTA